MKKISIIGGSGFIGHNLALLLKKEEFDVSIIDNLEINNLGSIEKNENNLPFPKLSTLILNQRINFLKENKISLIKIDAKIIKKLMKHLKR